MEPYSKKVKYIATCPDGICILDISETRRVNPTYDVPGHRVCVHHKGMVVATRKECRHCGNFFEAPVKNVRCFVCPTCREKIESEKEVKRAKRLETRGKLAKRRISPEKDNLIIYCMSCGCDLREHELVRIKEGVSCRKHEGSRVVSRKKECLDCGSVFPIGKFGKGFVRCFECAEKYKALQKMSRRVGGAIAPVAAAVRANSKYHAWEVDKRGSYCRYLLSCRGLGCLNCAGCTEFSAIFRGVDPEKLGYWV